MADKVFAVLGDPVSNSLSPRIHAAAYSYLKLDYEYLAIRVAKGDLSEFIASEGDKYRGFSITMPLKFEAAEIGIPSSNLSGTGVANTLLRVSHGWEAYNTDVAGIRYALRNIWQSNPKRVCVLGAGATARSALVALQEYELESVAIFARDVEKASVLEQLANGVAAGVSIQALKDFSGDFDLVLNTLPSGVVSNKSNLEIQDGWLLSAGYADSDTSFGKSFRPDRLIPGTEMLLGQAVEQIRIFTGQEELRNELIDVMRSALQLL